MRRGGARPHAEGHHPVSRVRAARAQAHRSRSPPAEFERWTALKRSLSQQFSPGLGRVGADRRQSVRVPTRLAVSFGSEGELQQSLLTNLSRGGVFISTEHVADIGTHLELHIAIDETGEVIRVPAEVVSQNVGPRFASIQRGMGLRFGEMCNDVRKKIENLYESALCRAADPPLAKRD